MARYNEILVGRYNRMVQKLLSLKGAASLVTIADEMVPVLPLFYGAENRYLEGWNRFGAHVNIAASVGNVDGVKIRNPVGSNVIAVIEKALIAAGAADTLVLSVGPDTADYSSVVSFQRLDPRGQTSSTSRVSGQAAPGAGIGTNIAAFPVLALTSFDFVLTDIGELPLLPGDSYDLRSSATNIQLRWSLIWRERLLEDSERA